MASDGDAGREARIDLAACYRLAARYGLNEGISNHFTLRHPDRPDHFLVIPHGMHWEEVTAHSLLRVNQEGEVLEGDGEIEASAFFIHSRILRARPDSTTVLHTHMTFATTLTTFENGRLLPISQNALRFHGRVAYHDSYRGAADNDDEGMSLARSLGDKAVLFHANHGVVIVGDSVARAFDDLYFLERACEVQIRAQSTGESLRGISDEIAEAYVSESRANPLSHQADVHFRALKRLLDRDAPDYRE